jgi:hypothetical protein
MQENTAYIEATMNKDHFWKIGTNEDGHHKYVQMPAYTVGGNPADPALAAGMSGEIYFRTVSATNARVEAFYRNTNQIYQIGPSLQTGSVSVAGSYISVAVVPDNSYGLIYMWIPGNNKNMAHGFFNAIGGVCQAFCSVTRLNDSGTNKTVLIFGNDSFASGLNIRAKTQDGSNGTYDYRIVYWGI